ncbi:MAG: hypothetical protein BroJett015_22080 [Chloroflexota bacterium]|nr:MAG: hypothetical protein BroJett015_22080 [Chloroflexota bacterium]
MVANPNPDKILTIRNSKGAMAQTNSRRPKWPDLFEVKRRVSGVLFEQFEVFASQILHGF